MKFPLKTAIIENEPDELKKLKDLLETRKDIFDVREAISEYGVAVQVLKLRQFDLGIFDVALDEGQDCVNLINEVGPENFDLIALTTQFPSVPKKALNIRGVLPFEKPYRQDNLEVFIKVLEKEVKEIQNLIVYRIPTPGGKIVSIRQDKICFVSGKGKETEYYVVENYQREKKKIVSIDTLEKALERLSKDFFMQIHRSTIFNISFYQSHRSGRIIGRKTSTIIDTGIRSNIKIKCSNQYLDELIERNGKLV